jgi:tetratricopeptide (TPR) repeat protein
MSENESKRWLVKDSEARVIGPFTTEVILKKIRSGEFTGDEQISLYPGTHWIQLSNDPIFYDQLLESLQKVDDSMPGDDENTEPSLADKWGETPIERVPTAKTAIPDITKKNKEAGHYETPQVNRAERVSKTEDKNNESSKIKNKRDKKSEKKDPRSENKKDIELEKGKNVLKKTKQKKSVLPTFLAAVAVIFVLFYMFSGDVSNQGKVNFVAPRSDQPQRSPEEIKKYIGNGVAYFRQDTRSNYLRAQDELVRAIEGDLKNAGAMALLCMTYYELWVHSAQDADDLQALSDLNQLVSKVDSVSIEASTCRTVDYLIRGKMTEARGLTETVLEAYSGTGQPPLAFYYFKSLLLAQSKEIGPAIDYIVSAQKAWPEWIKLYFVEGELRDKNNDFQTAARRFTQILTANSNHSSAKIYLGHLEYFKLKNYQKGKDLLLQGVGSSDKAQNSILSMGFLSLAEIAINEKNNSEAVSYAQKAYSLNAGSERAKQIIVALGGSDKLRSTVILDEQLIFEGDQLQREGDCNAAQAVYKSAFERNKKNGLAAMKAAECLWNMSLTTEALDWLNKAIQADPKLIDAYTLMADYYTRRYNFNSASQVLSKAREMAPQNYKVYRGFALIELRRNGAENAATYAEKAIGLYASDVESYVILTRARLKQNDATKAFTAASRAVEIDQNNRAVQVAYAEAIAAARGAYVGIDYLTRLSETYPTITEYRMALGKMYLNEQSYANAENVFRQVIRIEEKPKEAHLELGQALFMQKRYEEAKSAYYNAAALDPADVEPLFRVGLMLLELSKPTEARQQFNRVLAVNKEYPLVNYYIGRAALQLESYDEAIQQAQIEKSKNPGLADSYILAGDAYLEMKQYSLCSNELQQAIKLRANVTSLYVKLSSCYRMAGNVDVAEMTINQAERIESGNPDIWKELGAINEVRGNKIKAIESYNQYLVLAPNAPDRADILSRIDVLSR